MSTGAQKTAEPTAAAGVLGIDPVTFEVIRHRLWAINDDQGRMAARLSGSFIVYEGYDFNAALVTADGRGLYCGMYILQHGATIDEFVRRIMAEWPAEEIREGDMFFTNDPWWGALHANDGILAMPIFWRGRLVAWSGIAMHDNDVGSPVPGSFVSGASDRFGEAPLFPGVKMVEGFEPRTDVERAYLRNSRVPEHNALNMRARVAALRMTHQRICELIDQQSLEAFLATQEGIIEYVERVVRGRLREIPDGEWYAMGYHDHDGNENRIYRLCCRVIKRGEGVTFDLRGTSPQAVGSINCARPAMEGAIIGVILTFLCYDIPWAIGGLRNIVEIISEPGTLNNAVSPAGVSMASVMGTLSTQDVAAHAFAKMLLCSGRYREEAQASWTPGINASLMVAPDPPNSPSVGGVIDPISGGGGARTFRDGVDSGGIFHSMASQGANAETVESRVPVLQIYRREACDGGGPGEYRGGVPVEFASVPHKLPQGHAMLNTHSSGFSVPAGRGLSGGAPGAAASMVVLRGSAIRRLLAAGSLPVPVDAIDREALEAVPAKSLLRVGEDDVLIGRIAGGAGYGDPLRREPQLVLEDVRNGLVSEAFARSAYGVAIAGGTVDVEATDRLRSATRDARRASAAPSEASASDPIAPAGAGASAVLLHPVSGTIEAVADGDQRWLRCAICDRRLGAYEDDYKRSLALREMSLSSLGPHNGLCLDRFIAREYSCPGCGTAVALDIQDRDEPILDESRLLEPPPLAGRDHYMQSL